MKTKKEGDPVTGKVTKKIKGGLLVDIGVPVFLPASQVDIRRPGEISDWIGRTIDAVILKIDEERRNIVISRRKMIEQQREELKKQDARRPRRSARSSRAPSRTSPTSARSSTWAASTACCTSPICRWGRINHPSEVLKIDQEIEVKVLSIDKDKEKIALGLKQKDASPWENIETKYPVGSVHEAEVVNIMSYGAFCKLEEGVEGLVHISEMSWTKRINHPSRSGHAGPEGQGQGSGDQQGQAGNQPRHEAGRGEPLGARGREVSARLGGQGQGPQHRQLRRVRRDRRRHRRPAARQRSVLDQEDRPSVAKCSRRAKKCRRSCSASIRRSSASRWA